MADISISSPASWQAFVPAVAVMTTPVLIADADRIIRFLNAPAKLLLQKSSVRVSQNKLDGISLDLLDGGLAPTDRQGKPVAAHDETTEFDPHVRYASTPVFDGDGLCEAFIVELSDMSERQAASTERDNILAELDSFSVQIDQLAAVVQHGETDYVIDPSRFALPALSNAAQRLNAMMLSQMQADVQVIDVLAEFGKGHFDAVLPFQTGRRAMIGGAITTVRSNLKNVLAEVSRLSDAILAGNLETRADAGKFEGDYKRLVVAFEAAFAGLNTSFATLVGQIDQVAASVGQISHSSQVVSTSSQVASASVEQVSASVAQTDQQVRRNAEASRKAAHFVETAANLASKGTNQIADMVTAMQGIKTSSEDIAKIIKVIDEIAFQTNLLALNAAVEAARAGQHGRGFAVVAQEVRNLAGRSAKAARETSDLIADAASRVGQGVRIADDTADAFKGITGQILQARDIVVEIDRSSDEQSRSVAQISLAMNEIARSMLDTNQQADALAVSATQMTAATDMMKAAVQKFIRRPSGQPGVKNDAIPADIMMQIQQMLSAPAQVPAKQRVPSSLDRDERGFANF